MDLLSIQMLPTIIIGSGNYTGLVTILHGIKTSIQLFYYFCNFLVVILLPRLSGSNVCSGARDHGYYTRIVGKIFF